MKKCIFILFVFLQILIFGANKSLSTLSTAKFDVVEKTNINGKKREIKYSIDFKLPNKTKKEILAPELNKGEIYIYDYSKNKKIVYLPMFNEVKENVVQDDENRIIKAINKIKEEEKKNKTFSKNYNTKKRQNLKLDKDTDIEILSYIEVDGYIFPETVTIKDKGTKIGEIKISNLIVNKTIEDSIFDSPKK